MGAPQLWVWIGSPGEKLDVMRYARATESDILRQPLVVAEHEALKARVAELEKHCHDLEAEVGRWRSDWTHLKAAIVTMPTYAYCERHRGGAREIDIDSIRLGLIDRYSAIEHERERSKRAIGKSASNDVHAPGDVEG